MKRRECRRILLLLATGVVLLASACVRAHDATIDNPCDRELSIASYRVPPSRLSEDERVARFRLPAEKVTKVEGAFDEAAGTQWTLVVQETDFEIEVSKQQVENETILIPAAACPDG